ncbi:MAG TPA: hypothetical protein DIT64_04410 [Verrucomicrobiales bacterium]|nr:hypothetical protein [Verrucomicrobiales bacterium]HRJ07027.1 hypothetical protein [Prosthecobacter sp.]HRK16556.1 hypothetical protein [Prosthecobacter sp.]
MTASEQRLALGLGAVLVIGGAFIGLTRLKSWKQRVDARAIEVQSRKLEADDLLSQQDFWNTRLQWLEQKQPLYTRRSEADLSLLDLIQKSAGSHGITLTQNQPVAPSERPGLTSSNMNVEARAGWEAMNRWLHDLQRPESFISIPALTMTPNEEDTSEVIVNMNIQKWFRLPPS